MKKPSLVSADGRWVNCSAAPPPEKQFLEIRAYTHTCSDRVFFALISFLAFGDMKTVPFRFCFAWLRRTWWHRKALDKFHGCFVWGEMNYNYIKLPWDRGAWSTIHTSNSSCSRPPPWNNGTRTPSNLYIQTQPQKLQREPCNFKNKF